VITAAATRSRTSTGETVSSDSTAVTATPSTNHVSRNHGSPGIGSSRCVITHVMPSAEAHAPHRTSCSSRVGRPRVARGTAGGASSSYDGRTVWPVAAAVVGVVVITRPSRHRSDCG
jgi:hypothetical protein